MAVAMEALSRANGAFALDLYRALSKESPGASLIVSPLSISTALAMVYMGARTRTHTEMGKVMRFDQVPDVHSHLQTLMGKVTTPSSSHVLNLANRLFGEKTFGFSPEFLSGIQKNYLAELQGMDFLQASEEARQTINQWVKEKTENKIEELLKSGVLSTMTRLVLVNAVYFKGSWMHRFQKEQTQEMPFKINHAETRPVQMMCQTKKLPYGWVDDLEMQVLELPYTQRELSMFILLPPANKTLTKLENKLTIENLLEWTDPANLDDGSDVVLHLPRFKLETSLSLGDTLSGLGMGSLFDEGTADLSGMSANGGLSISALAHSAVCDVTEEGTEAAAATAAMASFCMLREEHFMADHPFLFLIMHNPTRSILFLGRYCGPQ
ncbi:leukocyte elastase inhibitor isoform X2 [Sardina pilchardus]|uniref:leukocyte elastase inhibitor isoform X2 n=1 Tax=Sardina pilchardus TaxID=27697 RepID=UPI002E112712